MINKCPNMSHPNWVALTNKYGEDATWALYLKNGENIPESLSQVANLMKPDSKTQKEALADSQHLTMVNNAITEQLQAMGVGVGVLTEYEESLGVSGVFDPTVNRTTGDNLVECIRIAQGNKGNEALPEEFAHLVGAVLRDTGNPIYDRLTNVLKDPELIRQVMEDIEEGSYDRYNVLYNGDINRLANEARERLIAKHILRNEAIKEAPYKSLLERLKNWFKRVFSKGNANTLQKQLAKADAVYGDFASDLMEGKIDIRINLNSIRSQSIMYNAKQSITKSEKALKKIIETQYKMSKITESSDRLTPEQEDTLETRQLWISRLERKKNQKRFDEGILDFLDVAHTDMQEILKSMDKLKLKGNIPTADIQEIAKFLRSLKQFINAYKPIAKELTDLVVSDEYKNQDLYDLSEPLKDFNQVLNIAEAQYEQASYPMFRQYIGQFTGDLIGKSIKGRRITEEALDMLLVEADRDISFKDRWLDSMAESSDLMLRLIERPVKNAKFFAQKKAEDKIKELQYAQEVLEKAGYKTDFIYERDENGELTGRYIQELDWSAFYKAKNLEVERLNKKHGEQNDAWYKDYNTWRDANMIQEEDSSKFLPMRSKYSNKVYTNLAPAQKTFYHKIIGIKNELDLLLPENKMNPYLLPQIRKDFLERLKDAKGVKHGRNLIGSHFVDQWVIRESDDEFGSNRALKGTKGTKGIKYGIQDFDGSQLNLVPMYYITPLKDMKDLSTDIVSSMAMYASMAYNYEAMSSIVDIMEIGKDLMSGRNIRETSGGKPLVEKFKSGGRTIENKMHLKKGSSRFIDKLQDFYDAQIYGKTQKDEGGWNIPFTDNQLSVAKVVNNVNKATSMSTYAVNLLSAVSNVTMGVTMMHIEAVAKEYLNARDLAWADKKYATEIKGTLAQLGRRRKTNKLDLMLTEFNVLQDANKAVKEIEMNKKNIFARMCQSSTVFFMSNAGEHFMQTRTFLALANKYKLKDKYGKEINLYEAFEVVKGSDGIERVVVKKGVTKLNGKAFTREDVRAISQKSATINHKLHGIYNAEDMNAFQRTAIGRLASMFRKWIVSSLNRRFKGENYSFGLDAVEQGYYNTVWEFSKTLAKDLKNHQFNIAMRWKDLSNHQRANAIRAITEVGLFMATALAFSLLSAGWEDDDDWSKSFTLYQLRRLQTEMGALIPGPQMLGESLTILKSPVASLNYIQNMLELLYIGDALEDPLQSGQYKGWNRYTKNFVKVLPFNNSIRRVFNLDEAIKFYALTR